MPPERPASMYGPGVTAASKAVLLELMATLRAYREALVLVGGWVPYFLLAREQPPDDPFVHVGSIDIDLAVDPAKVREPEYATIVDLLKERGFRAAADQRGAKIPHSLERTVPSPATHKPYPIRIDFLTPLDATTSSRHVPVQDDLMARKVRGCEAAFAYHTVFELTGVLPEGGELTVPVRMADVAAILTMKGIVVGERYREKDAYDIYALVKHYREGPRDVAAALAPHAGHPLVRESMANIDRAFRTRDAHGPAWAASFLIHPRFDAEYQRLVTDAFMVVHEFTARLSAQASPAA